MEDQAKNEEEKTEQPKRNARDAHISLLGKQVWDFALNLVMKDDQIGLDDAMDVSAALISTAMFLCSKFGMDVPSQNQMWAAILSDNAHLINKACLKTALGLGGTIDMPETKPVATDSGANPPEQNPQSEG